MEHPPRHRLSGTDYPTAEHLPLPGTRRAKTTPLLGRSRSWSSHPEAILGILILDWPPGKTDPQSRKQCCGSSWLSRKCQRQEKIHPNCPGQNDQCYNHSWELQWSSFWRGGRGCGRGCGGDGRNEGGVRGSVYPDEIRKRPKRSPNLAEEARTAPRRRTNRARLGRRHERKRKRRPQRPVPTASSSGPRGPCGALAGPRPPRVV